MKKGKLVVCALGLAVSCALAFGGGAAWAASGSVQAGVIAGDLSATASGPSAELDKVVKRFPAHGELFEATGDNLADVLKEAGSVASEAHPAIVHATATVPVNKCAIPENVILVGEKSTKYVCSGAALGVGFVVNGSMFGGVVEGKKVKYPITAIGAKTNSVGGFIEDVSVVSGAVYGISIRNESTGFKISNCTVSKVGDCGIQATGGSTIDLISGCTIANCGESGIDLICANVTKIEKCKITNSGGHGISTDTDHASAYPQQGNCAIGSIVNTKVSGSVHHGIYLENKCSVKLIKGCKVFANEKVGLCVLSGGAVKKVANSNLYGNADKNVTASGKGATITFAAKNKVYKAKASHGISVSDGGKVTIKGANNVVRDNAYNGVNVTGAGSAIKFTGKNLKVEHNAKNGISLSLGASGNVSNTTFGRNLGLAVYVGAGCTFTYKNCNISTSATAENRLYRA